MNDEDLNDRDLDEYEVEMFLKKTDFSCFSMVHQNKLRNQIISASLHEQDESESRILQDYELDAASGGMGNIDIKNGEL